MLRLLGRPRQLCDGLTRRDLLRVGGLGLFGLNIESLSRLQAAQTSQATSGPFGQAKSCILIHLFGAAPQHETFDPKPEAPVEIQGEMKSIETVVPGIAIGEGLPQVALIADRLTFVRSLTHPWPFHSVEYAITGIPKISATVEADPNDRTAWPFLGSVMDYLATQGDPHRRPEIPRNVALPFPLYAHVNFRLIGGPYAGFLGQQYDPLWTGFNAPGTGKVPTLVESAEVLDPYGGILPTDRFEFGGRAATDPPSPARLGLRRLLLQRFDQGRRDLDEHVRVHGYDGHRESACNLLTSSKLTTALDVQQEPAAMREKYGMNLFGQSLLAARRVIEAGGKFVTVIWDAYGHFAAGWDTHSNHYPRLKQYLLPGFDHSFPALIRDLESRGLLDETLVLCLTEHGRTPQLNNKPGAGREHWSRVYSSVLAGGGIGKGQVVGRSDKIGGDVHSNPVSPKDILASAFHLLGVDPHTTIPDQLGRPVPIAGEGTVRSELFA